MPAQAQYSQRQKSRFFDRQNPHVLSIQISTQLRGEWNRKRSIPTSDLAPISFDSEVTANIGMNPETGDIDRVMRGPMAMEM